MKKIKIFFTILLIPLVFGCDKGFEEMNVDPFKPTSAEISPVFTTVVASMQLGWQERTGFAYENMQYKAQQTNVFALSGYLQLNASRDIWNNYYFALTNIRYIQSEIEDYSGDKNTANIKALTDIVLAYKTLKMLDIYGDIPFYTASMATEGIEFFRPEYDDQKQIYTEMLALLKTASASIVEGASDEEYLAYGSYDVFFNYDLGMWKKFANTLRLYHALKAVDKESGYADHVSDILGGNLPLIEDGEDIAFWPQRLPNVSFTQRMWSYSGGFVRFGTTMWNEMADGTEDADIFDPRVHVFVERNKDLEWAPYPFVDPPIEQGQPYGTDRYKNWVEGGGDWDFSPINYWLLADENTLPEIMFTSAQVHFLKAEAYAKGVGVSKNSSTAKAEYESGIRGSIGFWYNVVATSVAGGGDKAWQSPPAAPEDGVITAMLANPKVAWNDTDALKLIYTQRWIDSFRTPADAWNLSRYTDLLPHEGMEHDFNRLFYPESEGMNNNANYSAQVSKMGADDLLVKVWWAK